MFIYTFHSFKNNILSSFLFSLPLLCVLFSGCGKTETVPTPLPVSPIISEEKLNTVKEVSKTKLKDIIVLDEDKGTDIYPVLEALHPFWTTDQVLPTPDAGPMGCSDPLATNYNDMVSAINDDCSCEYEGYTKPTLVNTVTTYRNFFIEVFTANWSGEGAVGYEAVKLTHEDFVARNTTDGTNYKVIDMYSHVNGTRRDPLSNTLTEGRFLGLFDGSVTATYPAFVFDNNREDALTSIDNNLFRKIIRRCVAGTKISHVLDIGITSNYVSGRIKATWAIKKRTGNNETVLSDLSYGVYLVQHNVRGTQENVASNNIREYSSYPDLLRRESLITLNHPYVLREEVQTGDVSSLTLLKGEGVYTRSIDYASRLDIRDLPNYHLIIIFYSNNRATPWVWNAARVNLIGDITW